MLLAQVWAAALLSILPTSTGPAHADYVLPEVVYSVMKRKEVLVHTLAWWNCQPQVGSSSKHHLREDP